jgi:hypothetical protein
MTFCSLTIGAAAIIGGYGRGAIMVNGEFAAMERLKRSPDARIDLIATDGAVAQWPEKSTDLLIPDLNPAFRVSELTVPWRERAHVVDIDGHMLMPPREGLITMAKQKKSKKELERLIFESLPEPRDFTITVFPDPVVGWTATAKTNVGDTMKAQISFEMTLLLLRAQYDLAES